jgi:spore germination protein YaaH
MKRLMIMVLLFLLLAASAVAGYYFRQYSELSGRFAQTFYRSRVTVDDNIIPAGMTYQASENRLWLDIRIVSGWIDTEATQSPSGERLYLQFDTLGFKTGNASMDAYLKANLETLSLPILVIEGEKYVELEGLARLYDLTYQRSPETDLLNITTYKAEAIDLSVTKTTQAVVDGIKVFKVTTDKTWRGLKRQDGTLAVIHADGRMGYINPSSGISDKPVSLLQEPRAITDKVSPGLIVGVWDQVHNFAQNLSFDPSNGERTGNVIMPTWFDLNVDGIVLNTADSEYVRSAHEAGWQVWGLYKNAFNPERTSVMMRTPALADRTIAHIVAYATAYELDGINIDFENMYLKDQAAFSGYVTKLAEALHSVGKWVSIDVTVPGGSDQWSKVYDRKALSSKVDYVFLMAYDEFWAASPKSGSVASRNWVIKGIEESLALIPREKLVLGMPLYTRIWKETGTLNAPKVSSSTLGYNKTKAYLEEKKLTPIFDEVSGQNFVSYSEGSIRYKIWLEDRTSLEMRLELLVKYHLAGLGFWSIDFINEEVWNVIEESDSGMNQMR